MSKSTSTWSLGLVALALVACTGNTLDGGSSKGSSGTSGTSGASSGADDDAAAAGSGDRTLGQGCDSVAECTSGLVCKQNFVADQCTIQKTCTLLCKTDPDCQALDPKGKCFQGCNGEKICMLTP